MPGEKELRDRAADGITPADQAIPVKRRSVSESARLRDDRFIKVKERGGGPASDLGGTKTQLASLWLKACFRCVSMA
jgi:hypothetical protein